jgi:cytidylate kinase
VLNEIRARDARDSSRATAPLSAAADALVLDTTNLSAADAIDTAVKIVESARLNTRLEDWA